MMNKMLKIFKLTLFFIITIIATPMLGQVIIHGIVTDAETGSDLPVANIQIEGTYRGAITNSDGLFYLKVNKIPCTIIVSYIGYFPKRIAIENVSDLIVQLQPTVIRMPEVVVDREDPAVKIMRKVIEKKQQWWDDLKSYKADAYCRTTFSNDTGIVLIKEHLSEAYWDKSKGTKDVFKSMRQSADTGDDFLAGVSHFPNFYHDNVEVAGFDMISVIHPRALKLYKFQLTGERNLDDNILYEISVNPRTRFQPVFKGKIFVQFPDYSLVGVDLETADHIIYPPPYKDVHFHFKQQFSNFGKDFWLPVSLVRDGEGTIALPGAVFSPIKFKDIYEIKDYDINILLPDSLFWDEEKSLVEESLIGNDSLFTNNENIILPLSDEEKQVFETTDSTFSFALAFKPRGILAKLIIEEVKKEEAAEKLKSGKNIENRVSLTPQVWFNRTEGLHLAFDNSFELVKGKRLNFLIGYTSALQKWTYGTKVQFRFLEIEYFYGSDLRYSSELYPRLLTGLSNIIGRPDYFDYYWNERIRLGLKHRLSRQNTLFYIGLTNENHTSLKKKTDYDIFGEDFIQRENPSINEGTLRSILFNIQYGSKYIPFGIIGQKRAILSIEHSSRDIYSDFSFSQLQLILDWRIPTFLKSRVLPNVIDLRVVAGTYAGELPLQKYGALDVSLGCFNTFGSFKSLGNYPYEGEKYFGVFWEHNFRTLPFEIFGISSIAKSGVEIILHGALGRTWIDGEKLKQLDYTPNYMNSYSHEIGISLNKLLKIFRIDFTYSLDKNEYYLSISVPRMM